MNIETPKRRIEGTEPQKDDPRPVVTVPNAGLPGFAIAGMAAVLAILLFVMLDGKRRQTEREVPGAGATQAGTFASPPPLVVPTEAPAAPFFGQQPAISIPIQRMPVPVRQPRTTAPSPMIAPYTPYMPTPEAPAFTAEPAPAAPQTASRSVSTEPALIYDAGGPAGETHLASTDPSPASTGPGNPPRQGPAEARPAARLTRITNSTTVVPPGSLIRAVLETPIDTSRPGLARAIVSREVRGFDGRRILIPRGARLIGEYEADVRTGQNNVLVNWTQLIRPDGSVMRLDSPSADATGAAGVPGRVNSFFLERFTNAVLQSALTIGGNVATWSSSAPVVIGLPSATVNATSVAGQSGLFGQAPQPRIKVKRGTAFHVFVARELDFSGTGSAQ